MPIPDFQSLMLPLLELLADEQEYSMREILNTMTLKFNLSNSQKQKLLPSGRQAVFENRVGWARTYLKKAGLVESPKRAFVKITNRGLEALQQNPDMINTSFLCQYAEFVEFRNISNSTNVKLIEDESDDLEDELEDESDDLEDELEDESDDLEDELEDESDDLEDELEDEPPQFSAKRLAIKKQLLKIVNEDATPHTLIVEGEEGEIVTTYLFGEEKLVTTWNRSTALKVAEAIQQYYFSK